jgi:hypothetical protein
MRSHADLQQKGKLRLQKPWIAGRVGKARTLEAEYESKNWVKIPLKFGPWVLFLAGVFVIRKSLFRPVSFC